MVVLVHCFLKSLSANFVETQQHGNQILFFLCLIFVWGVPVLSMCTEPLTVCVNLPTCIILYCFSVEHNICPYMNFPTAVERDVSRSNCDSDAAEMVVLGELYSLHILNPIFLKLVKNKLLRFYYCVYYNCVLAKK